MPSVTLLLAGCAGPGADTGPSDVIPALTLSNPADGATLDEGPLTVAGSVSDDHDAPTDLRVDVSSDLSGSLGRASVTEDGAFALDVSLESGAQTLSVVATDSAGNRAVAQVTLAVLAVVDAPPSAPSVVIAPATPVDGDDLSCVVVADAEDPEGLAVTYAWEWTRDGVLVSTDSVVLGVATGEAWGCTVTAADPAGNTSTGTASVVIGRTWTGLEAAGRADVVIDGLAADGAFGTAVALLGDLDADGLSELAVSADGEDEGAGAVYVFSGAKLDAAVTTADATARWAGAWEAGRLGGARGLAAPGDLDGDGAADLLFAAPNAAYGGDDAGVAGLVYGDDGTTGDHDADRADWLVYGAAGDQAGARLAAADLDGDGLSDVVIGAPTASDSGASAGRVGIFYGLGDRWDGDADLDAADALVLGDLAGDGLGWAAGGAGDLDGDGHGDLVLGAPFADDAAADAGVAAIVAGGGALSGTVYLAEVATVRLRGGAEGDRLGYDAVGDVDVDDDGVGDLVVGAYQADGGAVDAGAAYVFLGRATWGDAVDVTEADATILGSTPSARFGRALGAPGDVDDDGVGDLLIGASFDAPTGLASQGAASLLLAADWATVEVDTALSWRAYGEAAADQLGDALAAGRGDVDGDGRPDVAVGAQGYDGSGSATGRVYLWRGR